MKIFLTVSCVSKSLTCLQGKLKVKPSGNAVSLMLRVSMNLAKQEAMWSNRSVPGPVIIDYKHLILLSICIYEFTFGMANISLSISNFCPFPISIRTTLKFVPPRSRAKNFPTYRCNPRMMSSQLNLTSYPLGSSLT